MLWPGHQAGATRAEEPVIEPVSRHFFELSYHAPRWRNEEVTTLKITLDQPVDFMVLRRSIKSHIMSTMSQSILCKWLLIKFFLQNKAVHKIAWVLVKICKNMIWGTLYGSVWYGMIVNISPFPLSFPCVQLSGLHIYTFTIVVGSPYTRSLYSEIKSCIVLYIPVSRLTRIYVYQNLFAKFVPFTQFVTLSLFALEWRPLLRCTEYPAHRISSRIIWP